MAFGDLLRVAFTAISVNKLRSFLTTLGIVVGIAAVITMVALGEGAQRAVRDRLTNLGANVLTVRSGQQLFVGLPRGRVPLTVKDADALDSDPAFSDITIAPQMEGRLQVEFKARNANLSVIGTWRDLFTIQKEELAAGRLFNDLEEGAHRRVAVIGASVGDALGVATTDLVTQTILLAGTPFEVVGSLQERGSDGWADPSESIYVPLSTARLRLFGTDHVRAIGLQAPTTEAIGPLIVDVDRILRREHRIRPGQSADFSIGDNGSLLAAMQETSRTMAFLLAGIAAISLFVGGIGIMNTMLVSVTERTQEIGLRMAVGARRSDILRQFLAEAVALCFMGGTLGLLLGWSASTLLEKFAGWNVEVTLMSALVAVAFSLAVGLGFGFWPARRAASLLPVEALRYD